MAHGAVAAQAAGQDFQGRIFWHYAADLRRVPPAVQKVCYEYDAAAGVDDVVVFYTDPFLDGNQHYEVDAIQAKFHVDHKHAYSLTSLTEAKDNGSSLLQKMYSGYQEIRKKGLRCRAILETNWGWSNEDPVAKEVRANRRLPDRFLTVNPPSPLAKIRKQWQDHLDINDNDLSDFVRDLRLDLSLPALDRQLNDLGARLEAARLKPLSPSQRTNPYDSIIRHLLQAQEPIEMDRNRLEEICREEGLLEDAEPPSIEGQVGIRSFIRWSERMEVDCLAHVDVTEYFTGDRYIRSPEQWEAVRKKVTTFLEKVLQADNADRIVLESHLTIAYLAGRCLPPISGTSIIPVQKRPHGGPEPWRPAHPVPKGLPGWNVDETTGIDGSRDVVVALSVTHDILNDALHYCEEAELVPRSILHFRPEAGPGPVSVLDASHAHLLAAEGVKLIRRAKQHGERVHIFMAAPNALAFFLGQIMTELVDPIQLYEHDRQGVHGVPYSPSLSFPPPQ
ncbi:SAVED domain-containing protein [Halomonas sp. LBP4]|uniref:SAVED domain-containing protein n=1 Tax=Halomonas sp. LBP4 TaxID=2044917 RepID=UPI000D774F74|nr:SAVED domain-containing protein [Halomonas sp. LBP4]